MKNFRNKLKLDKISEASSPDVGKQLSSPLKTTKGRIIMGGMGDSYLSFFKIESEAEKHSKPVSQLKRNQVSRHSIAEKDQIIQNLQQQIMKQTVKKNAREKCFQQRISTDWRKHVEYFIMKLVHICIELSSRNKEHRRNVLKVVHKWCRMRKEGKKTNYIIIAWILQWLQPILRMFHQTIRKKYS